MGPLECTNIQGGVEKVEPGSARWGPTMGPAAAAQELPAEHEQELLPCAVTERWNTLPRGSGACLGGNCRAVRTRSWCVLWDRLHRPMSRCVPSKLLRSVRPDYRCGCCRGLQPRQETRAVKRKPRENKKHKPVRAAASRVRTCAGRPHWISSPTP